MLILKNFKKFFKYILKDATINKNSVVAYGSTVTKKFEQENVLIAGTPAKIVKENIYWKY